MEAQDNDVIGAQSREMLECGIRMADMPAGDLMLEAPRQDLLNNHATLDAMLIRGHATPHRLSPVTGGG